MKLRVPGDKSITQRALLLAGLAEGESRLSGLLHGEDPASTAAALRALGVAVPALPGDGGEIRLRGTGLGGLREPAGVVDLGNSGTGARLLLGVLAAQPFCSVLTGDASLRTRPMRRVTDPLARMGARFEELEAKGRLPLRVVGGALRPLDYDLPMASAQVKSALLLAGLAGGVPVRLTEPGRSRDHTERMLAAAGARVDGRAEGARWRVELPEPPERIRPLDFRVPGDFSSAAFFLALGVLGGAVPDLVLEHVGMNPTRTGLLAIVERMGGRVVVEPAGGGEGEPVAHLRALPAELAATEVGPDEVPAAIDEIPLVAALAVRARGATRVTGARELRVKETDRIRALAENLRAVGVEAEELDDGLEIQGTERPLTGRVDARGDHRIAMAFGVLGALPGNRIEIQGAEVVAVSYPGFWDDLARAAARPGRGATGVRDRTGSGGPSGPGREGLVITLDGPAGSGKSTTAREVARRLGYRHLDSGALYRALTWALLDGGVAPERWPALSAAELAAHGVRLEATGTGFRVRAGDRVLGDELRGPEVTSRVSRLASLPAVRGWLLDAQREAGLRGRLVADGRDMGTVVFPDADVKVFLTASLPERARRRLGDRGVQAPSPGEIDVEARSIEERDRRDQERELAPLRRPDDAFDVDTTGLSFEAQVEAILERVRTRETAARPTD